MSAEKVIEGPLGVADLPVVRLVPAAAERVAKAAAIEFARRVHLQQAREFREDLFDRVWHHGPDSAKTRANWTGVIAAVGEQLVAEMRLAGWKVEPPGAAGMTKLKGGV